MDNTAETERNDMRISHRIVPFAMIATVCRVASFNHYSIVFRYDMIDPLIIQLFSAEIDRLECRTVD